MAANDFTVGYEEIDNILKEFPKNIQISAIRAAAREGATIIRDRARTELIARIGRGNLNKDEQSKALYIKRNIVVRTSNSKKYPGADVVLKYQARIPVGKKWWNAAGYGILLAEGSYKTGRRYTKNTKTKQDRGVFKGFGNYMASADMQVGRRANTVFVNKIETHVNKALERTIRRYQKKI